MPTCVCKVKDVASAKESRSYDFMPASILTHIVLVTEHYPNPSLCAEEMRFHGRLTLGCF